MFVSFLTRELALLTQTSISHRLPEEDAVNWSKLEASMCWTGMRLMKSVMALPLHGPFRSKFRIEEDEML